MTDFEKAEKLRDKANVTYAEAKEALEKSDGDMLDAMIYLENLGKSTIPAGGGFYSGAGQPAPTQQRAHSDQTRDNYNPGYSSGESFSDMMRRFGRFCMRVLDMGVSNYLDAAKDGNPAFSCPVIAVVILCLFFFWITVPLFIISLFFGFRYRFRGPNLERDSINNVMESATDVVDDVKKSFKGHRNENHPDARYADAEYADAEYADNPNDINNSEM